MKGMRWNTLAQKAEAIVLSYALRLIERLPESARVCAPRARPCRFSCHSPIQQAKVFSQSSAPRRPASVCFGETNNARPMAAVGRYQPDGPASDQRRRVVIAIATFIAAEQLAQLDGTPVARDLSPKSRPQSRHA